MAASGGWITRADLMVVNRSPIMESIRTLVDGARARRVARPHWLQQTECEADIWNGFEDRQRRSFSEPEEMAAGDLYKQEGDDRRRSCRLNRGRNRERG